MLGVLAHWRELGGTVAYGSGKETSAILKLVPYGHNGFKLWCGAFYPTSGSLAIWFQHLKAKEPFSEVTVREELRRLLNEGPAINIAESKLGLRPSVPLSALAGDDSVKAVERAFAYLVGAAMGPTRGQLSELSGEQS
ncbi:MAG: hypothetical protein H6514_01020 [Acidimicrobiaceae bacterium]|nr:hypothetical protein [Acidimicrobiaceae bacterium]